MAEQTHAVLDLAHADQHPAAAMPRERYQIAIAKTVADLGGLAEHAIATGGIAGEHTLQREGKEQVPLFDAVLVRALEQFAPPCDPAAGPCALALVHQAEPKPERTSRSPRDGRFLEKLGTYNPLLASDDPARVVLREERIRHWLATGAKPSDRVARFLDGAGITANTVKFRGTGKKARELEAKKAEAEAAAGA